MKRLFILLLSVCMLICFMPAMAFADGESGGSGSTPSTTMCAVLSTSFVTSEDPDGYSYDRSKVTELINALSSDEVLSNFDINADQEFDCSFFLKTTDTNGTTTYAPITSNINVTQGTNNEGLVTREQGYNDVYYVSYSEPGDYKLSTTVNATTYNMDMHVSSGSLAFYAKTKNH